MTFAQASWVRECFTFEILRMLKYIFLAKELTCFIIDKEASRTAPRVFFFTLSLGFTIASPILMPTSLRRHCFWEPAATITSVFASFSLCLFTVIQNRTLAKQFSMVMAWKLRIAVTLTLTRLQSCVSSANPWQLMAYSFITLLSGRRYTRKRRGSRTNP